MEENKEEKVESEKVIEPKEDAITKKSRNPIVIFSVIAIVVALLGVIAIVNAKGSKSNDIRKQLDQGAQYLVEMDYVNAIATYEAVLAIDPKCEEAYVGIADAYIAMGDDVITGEDISLEAYELALSDYNAALEWLNKSTEYFESDNINTYIEEVNVKIYEVNEVMKSFSVSEEVVEPVNEQTEDTEAVVDETEDVSDEETETAEDDATEIEEVTEIEENIVEQVNEVPEEAVIEEVVPEEVPIETVQNEVTEEAKLIDPHGFEYRSKEQLTDYIKRQFYCENCGASLKGAKRIEGYMAVEDMQDGNGPRELFRFDYPDGSSGFFEAEYGSGHVDYCLNCDYDNFDMKNNGEYLRCDNWDTYEWAKSMGIQ